MRIDWEFRPRWTKSICISCPIYVYLFSYSNISGKRNIHLIRRGKVSPPRQQYPLRNQLNTDWIYVSPWWWLFWRRVVCTDFYWLIDWLIDFGFQRHFQQHFSYIMVTSFSGGRSRSTRREPPTMGKQLVDFITCGCESSAPFLEFTKPGANPHRIGDRLVWVVR